MNALLRTDLFPAKSLPARAPANAPAQDRLVRRERDFGIGYGRSSGYGNPHRYTSDWASPASAAPEPRFLRPRSGAPSRCLRVGRGLL